MSTAQQHTKRERRSILIASLSQLGVLNTSRNVENMATVTSAIESETVPLLRGEMNPSAENYVSIDGKVRKSSNSVLNSTASIHSLSNTAAVTATIATNKSKKRITKSCLALVLVQLVLILVAFILLFRPENCSRTGPEIAETTPALAPPTEEDPFPIDPVSRYWRQRSLWIDQERHLQSDYNTFATFNSKEQHIYHLMNHARYLDAVNCNADWNTVKQDLMNSTLHKYLKTMPKGGQLYAQLEGTVNRQWLVHELETCENCYILQQNDAIQVQWSVKKPLTDWESVRHAKQRLGLQFSSWILSYLELNHFQKEDIGIKLTTARGLLSELHLWRRYVRQALQDLSNESFQYAEWKVFMDSEDWVEMVQDKLEKRSFIDALQIIQEEAHEWRQSCSNCLGVKIILSLSTITLSQEQIERYLEMSVTLAKSFPGFIVGFDGSVVLSRHVPSLIWYLPQLADVGVRYTFEAGNQLNTASDFLADCILLNATRITQGLALAQHPFLASQIQEQDVTLVMTPVMHLRMGLVPSLHWHPGLAALMRGLSVLLASDNNALLGYHDKTLDWTLISFMVHWIDLATWKHWSFASLQKSGMTRAERDEAEKVLEKAWHQWIDTLHDDS